MSSKQTWERRVIAGLIEVIDEKGLDLIAGLEVSPAGDFTFSHEALTTTEAERVERSVQALRERLTGIYTRLGGGKAEQDNDGDSDDEEEQPPVTSSAPTAAEPAPATAPAASLPATPWPDDRLTGVNPVVTGHPAAGAAGDGASTEGSEEENPAAEPAEPAAPVDPFADDDEPFDSADGLDEESGWPGAADSGGSMVFDPELSPAGA